MLTQALHCPAAVPNARRSTSDPSNPLTRYGSIPVYKTPDTYHRAGIERAVEHAQMICGAGFYAAKPAIRANSWRHAVPTLNV